MSEATDVAAAFTFILHVLLRDFEAKHDFDRQGFADELKRQVEDAPPSIKGLVEAFAKNIVSLNLQKKPWTPIVIENKD